MGGGIALQFALLYPQWIEQLVLVNSLGLGQRISWSLRLTNLLLADKLYLPTRNSTALTLKQSIANQALITDEWVDRFYDLLGLPGAPAALIAQIRTTVKLAGSIERFTSQSSIASTPSPRPHCHRGRPRPNFARRPRPNRDAALAECLSPAFRFLWTLVTL